jgi:hypothetical protein
VQRLAEQIASRLSLLPALGAAATRFVAQLAAAISGAGAAVIVPPGCEAPFLAPQPITALPIDTEIIQRLHLLGLRTIGALAQLPLDALQAQFGGHGRLLYQLARGGSDLPIGVTAAPPALARTARFAGPISNRGLLEAALGRLVERLAAQLDAGGWAVRTIIVTLHLDDGAPWTAQRTLSAPTAERSKLKEAFLALSRTAALETGIEALSLQISELAPTVATQLDCLPQPPARPSTWTPRWSASAPDTPAALCARAWPTRPRSCPSGACASSHGIAHEPLLAGRAADRGDVRRARRADSVCVAGPPPHRCHDTGALAGGRKLVATAGLARILYADHAQRPTGADLPRRARRQLAAPARV